MNHRNNSQNKKDSKAGVKKKSGKLPPSSAAANNRQFVSMQRNIHSASSPDSGQKNNSNRKSLHNISVDKQHDQFQQLNNQHKENPIDEFLNNSIQEYLVKKEYSNTLDSFKDELSYRPSNKISIDNMQNVLLDVLQNHYLLLILNINLIIGF